MWFWFALGSAVFAALTSILAKIGILWCCKGLRAFSYRTACKEQV
jgi:uncharacterized membrane protein